MNKSAKYAINGALLLGVANGLINLINQANIQDANQEIDWKACLKAALKGAFAGGFGGFVVGSIKDEKMAMVLTCAGGMSGYMKQTLEEYDDLDREFFKKIDKLNAAIFEKFNSFLKEYPSINGSTQRGTSTVYSDIDIQVKFQKRTGTISEIFELVYVYFHEEYHDRNLVDVRLQKHSVGLVYQFRGESKQVDIVPVREIENGEGDAFLYVNSFNAFQVPSIKKTNAAKQSSALKFSAKQKKIVKLLKGWKFENDLVVKSIILEYLTKAAFSSVRMPVQIDKCLLKVVAFIGNNIVTTKITDPANSNNIISDTLSFNEKMEVQNFCLKMIDDIKRDERNIIDYFQINLNI